MQSLLHMLCTECMIQCESEHECLGHVLVQSVNLRAISCMIAYFD